MDSCRKLRSDGNIKQNLPEFKPLLPKVHDAAIWQRDFLFLLFIFVFTGFIRIALL